MLLLPNGIENQCAKNLSWDKVALRILRSVSRSRPLQVLVCQDGRGQYTRRCEASHLPETDYSQTLYKCYMSTATEFEFHNFSFFSPDVDKMKHLLQIADIFYMCGFGGKGAPYHLKCLFQARGGLLDQLVERVQFHQVLYIGICGGAKCAGTTYYPGDGIDRCFDFFNGFQVRYDANASPKLVEATSSCNEIQITSGCGVGIFLRPDEVLVASFPVVKNRLKWEGFAGANTRNLAQFTIPALVQWTCYNDESYPPDQWYFRLDGWVFKNEDYHVIDEQSLMHRGIAAS